MKGRKVERKVQEWERVVKEIRAKSEGRGGRKT